MSVDTIEKTVVVPSDMLESVQRLTRDLAKKSSTMDKSQARFMVNQYYQMQHSRITAESQAREQEKKGQSHEVLDWYKLQNKVMEDQVQRTLDKWTDAHFMGRWAKSIIGIGPVIAAGLLANIDIEIKRKVKDENTGDVVELTEIRATAASIWAYAGLAQVDVGACDHCHGVGYVETLPGMPPVPRSVYDLKAQNAMGMDPCPICRGAGKLTESPRWEKGKKRPWNADLKVLIAFKIGESFVKVQNNGADFYGKVFAQRKRLEIERNDLFLFKRQAEQILKAKKIDPKTDAYKAYAVGKLPPAHIHARARRFAAKLFISHYHYMMYRNHFGYPPPAPYPIEHLGHANWIMPPNMNFEQPEAK